MTNRENLAVQSPSAYYAAHTEEEIKVRLRRKKTHYYYDFVCFVCTSLPGDGSNVLGYQSHPLQRYLPACGHEGSSQLSPVLAL